MPDELPWYQDGLRFECTRCGHCCTGEPGFVWIDEEEARAIAARTGEPFKEFLALRTRVARGKRTLREKVNGDCIYFERDRGCTIYSVRPKQCRTWPFWESNLKDPEAWERTEGACPGAGQGELIPIEEIIRRVKVIKI